MDLGNCVKCGDLCRAVGRHPRGEFQAALGNERLTAEATVAPLPPSDEGAVKSAVKADSDGGREYYPSVTLIACQLP